MSSLYIESATAFIVFTTYSMKNFGPVFLFICSYPPSGFPSLKKLLSLFFGKLHESKVYIVKVS